MFNFSLAAVCSRAPFFHSIKFFLLRKKAFSCKAVIFDLDGCLLDSLSVWKGLAAKCVKESGGPILGQRESDKLDQKVFVMSMEECASYLIKTFGLKTNAGKIVQRANEILLEQYKNNVRLFPGAKKSLEALKSKGIRICAATSGDSLCEEAALKRLGIYDCFEKIFYCSQMKTSKSSPMIFNEAAKFMQCQPNQTLVVDDSKVALKTAKESGFKTFLV